MGGANNPEPSKDDEESDDEEQANATGKAGGLDAVTLGYHAHRKAQNKTQSSILDVFEDLERAASPDPGSSAETTPGSSSPSGFRGRPSADIDITADASVQTARPAAVTVRSSPRAAPQTTQSSFRGTPIPDTQGTSTILEALATSPAGGAISSFMFLDDSTGRARGGPLQTPELTPAPAAKKPPPGVVPLPRAAITVRLRFRTTPTDKFDADTIVASLTAGGNGLENTEFLERVLDRLNDGIVQNDEDDGALTMIEFML